MSYQITMENKVAVVTGAAQGIGAAIAAKYAEAGAQVVILDVCPESCAAELLQGLSKYGKKAAYYLCDVSDSPAVAAVFADVVHRFGRIDILVNNSGVLADWDKR